MCFNTDCRFINATWTFAFLAICSLLLLHSLPVGAKEDSSSYEKEMHEIENEFNCVGLQGNTVEMTIELIKECKDIMHSGFMQSSHERLKSVTKEELENARLEYIESLAGFHPRARRSPSGSKCPVMDAAYLRANREMNGMRSISPYESVIDYNPLRYPKYIVQQKCLCRGCIDITERREMSNNYRSHLITAEAQLFFKDSDTSVYTTKKEHINVGCTCVLA